MIALHPTVVVTGATGAIGSATSAALARRGARVILMARPSDRLDALVARVGGAGARIGTAFAASEEALGAPAAKQCFIDANETETIHTHVFGVIQRLSWPDEFPGRALANAFAKRWHGREAELIARLDETEGEFNQARTRND